ncbi:flavin monoamine oxidase family protein [Vibrio metschnikovii]|uniref:flavin monoamine oxidase family protein n=1 Tax=Vibrio metschnikovii TaxID=28172 RepID=UPI001C2FFB87|nr:FAD-dependent oxidoreductase [Vibrio metschnikovii]
MDHKQIAIIGGGLSGLYAATLLEAQGITNYVLLEARERLGGRIEDFSLKSGPKVEQFDLGPTWFWPEFQPQLNALIEKLGLQKFPQYDQGKTRIERAPNEKIVSIQGFTSSLQSMRLKGGMGTLIRALHSRLNNTNILLGNKVHSITKYDHNIEIRYQDVNQANTIQSIAADHVFLALSPRLAVESINFIPNLPTEVFEQWQKTATWMAPHAKYIAVYDHPFWRKEGLSGDARSAYGPMVEIHDATTSEGRVALFGFIGIPPNTRQAVGDEQMKVLCRAQMKRLFGDQAAKPYADIIKDWAKDPLTSTDLDLHALNDHHHTPEIGVKSGPWQHHLTGIASEWSVQFPGYIAGAIEAAYVGVEHYVNNKWSQDDNVCQIR